ncbi:diaminobutyrate--2-oxoglutarate transaminase [Shimwellia blattae]|nr:diaminobutyrate--2-oxoglutarate transaminase [Shimwellia blattae]GAB80843.1 putative 4-aminobutyrate aminotransferase [Shimwellia blattae DSM 4481 = NBRC 105725]VDY64528.1 Diaminobutyrate--2-oxoglutarate aminotransferase [Shimwellia blattae]VEC22636.1 Diaminobutyrate--2-oxoglutarate aminotransferase [Shimwellia blattae]
MTDKVRINTLNAHSEPQSNETFLARQAEFESNVRSYPRKLPFAIARAQGAWLTDVENNQYLDCLAGAGTLALGHNHPDVLQSIQNVITSGLPLHTLDLTTPLKDAFSAYLLSLLPGEGKEYCLQFTGPSGADAVEAALKLAKKVTGRSGIISFSGGYHGMTHGALAVTGNLSPKEAVHGMMPDVQFMPYPREYRCPLGIGGEAGVQALSDYFENLISDVESGVRKPAAVILEAIQGEGGVNPAPAAWLQRIRNVTREHGILLIVDEVQAGFARSGKFFAFEHAAIEPDIIVMSKAVGGGLPLAVLGIKKQFDAWSPGHHTGTFRGNQLAMATGLTTLKILKEENIAAKVADQGEWLKSELRGLQQRYPAIGHIRGRGLMIGIEMVNPAAAPDRQGCYPADGELAALIQKKCFEGGLILERGGRNGCVLRLLPSLLITSGELKIFLDKFETALQGAGLKPADTRGV